jgi:predicted TIM-barrel fold metal-dependent hydrolase
MAPTSTPYAITLPRTFGSLRWGVLRQSTLESTLREVCIDRALFSIDYPYEDTLETAQWFDSLALDDSTRGKLAYHCAKKLLRID